MNYGAHGRDLLLELKRSSGQVGGRGRCAPSLPAYNDRLVRACLEDLNVHVQALQDQVQAASTTTSSAASTSSSQQDSSSNKFSNNVRPSLMLQKAAIDRNKRCLLAYHQARCQAIAEAYWKNADLGSKSINTSTGSSNNGNQSNNNNVSNLSPAEDEFRKRYHEIVQKYTSDLSGEYSGILDDDLRSHLHPPVQPVSMVQVRVLKNDNNNGNGGGGGPIVLESGQTVHLGRPGALHYLLFSDVESMIRDGSMELLSTEEEENQPQNAFLARG
jgi:GINS complex protein